jgi:hypothetical protein
VNLPDLEKGARREAANYIAGRPTYIPAGGVRNVRRGFTLIELLVVIAIMRPLKKARS